jgi:glycosyltransferase involved in cell wall biosynthesis
MRSLVVPIYGNEENIADLMVAVSSIGENSQHFEAVFVVDGSPDRSLEMLEECLPIQNFSSKIVVLSRNFGSFAAIRTGMSYARGEVLGVMAADLQEPPELVLEFFETLEDDEADVVFGQRASREDKGFGVLLSRIYWGIFRRYVVREVPRGGIDIFGCKRNVANTILTFGEANTSLVAQLLWVGFRRKYILYDRRARTAGQSGWSFNKKLRYMLDSVFSFTDLPIQILFWLGLIGIFFSIFTGFLVLIARAFGEITMPGYTPLMLAISFFSSTQIFSLGIIGNYVSRVFENTKGRPITIVAATQDFNPGKKS